MQQPTNPLFFHGNRQSSIKHAQLRMIRWKLNHPLFLLHVINSAACECGFDCEDNKHYLLSCPLFHKDRITMFVDISLICDLVKT